MAILDVRHLVCFVVLLCVRVISAVVASAASTRRLRRVRVVASERRLSGAYDDGKYELTNSCFRRLVAGPCEYSMRRNSEQKLSKALTLMAASLSLAIVDY